MNQSPTTAKTKTQNQTKSIDNKQQHYILHGTQQISEEKTASMFALQRSTKIVHSCNSLVASLSKLSIASSAANLRSFSSPASVQEGREVVTFLSLNNLRDNAGAVKKVCISHLAVLIHF